MSKTSSHTSNSLPIIIVTGVLVKNKQDKYLLCMKPKGVGPYPNMWLTPGGGIENNESLDECAEREVYEETGVNISNLQRVFFDDFTTPNWRGNLVQFISVFYTADFDSGKLGATENDDDNMRKLKWFSQDELKLIPLNPPLEKVLKHLKLIKKNTEKHL